MARDVEPLPRGNHGLPRETVLASQRGRMLYAMMQAVATRGFATATVADVLKTARVSRETFYQQFQNKHACFLAAYSEGIAEVAKAMVEAVSELDAQGASGRERYDAAVLAYLETVATEPLIARTFLIDVFAAGPEVVRQRAETHQAFVDQIHGLLDTPEQPVERFTAEMLVGGISSVVTMRVAMDDVETLPELFPALSEHADRVLGTPGS